MIKIDFTTKPQESVIKYVVDKCGRKCTYDEGGDWHSYNDLPAVIWPSGSKFWYKHGKQHRDNGLPAIIHASGHKQWWKNGKRIT